MKIAHYASLSSLVLLLVAGVQAAALFHGWQQFNRAEQAQRQQERLQQQLSGPLQGAAQLLLQALLLALGLFGPIELLPAVKQGGGLNAGHQQQYQGGEGGIMGNFHI